MMQMRESSGMVKRSEDSEGLVDRKTDINYSTRYDDRELQDGTLEERLNDLSEHLNEEIEGSYSNIQKLERLGERYYSDGMAAQADDNMGYYMRYVRAYERIRNLVEAAFNVLPKWTG
jgi:hypothetical protein